MIDEELKSLFPLPPKPTDSIEILEGDIGKAEEADDSLELFAYDLSVMISDFKKTNQIPFKFEIDQLQDIKNDIEDLQG